MIFFHILIFIVGSVLLSLSISGYGRLINLTIKKDFFLEIFLGFPHRVEVLRQRFQSKGDTGLQDSVSLDGVLALNNFAVVFSVNAIFFNSAEM